MYNKNRTYTSVEYSTCVFYSRALMDFHKQECLFLTWYCAHGKLFKCDRKRFAFRASIFEFESMEKKTVCSRSRFRISNKIIAVGISNDFIVTKYALLRSHMIFDYIGNRIFPTLPPKRGRFILPTRSIIAARVIPLQLWRCSGQSVQTVCWKRLNSRKSTVTKTTVAKKKTVRMARVPLEYVRRKVTRSGLLMNSRGKKKTFKRPRYDLVYCSEYKRTEITGLVIEDCV